MNFLGKLFGTGTAATEVVGHVANGIDQLFYTEQEEAEGKAQARREGYAIYMEWLKSTSGSRVARRLIALLVTGIWAIEHIASVICGTVAIWATDKAPYLEASDMFARHANENNTLVGVVLLFYFGGPAAIDGVKGLVTKWSEK